MRGLPAPGPQAPLLKLGFPPEGDSPSTPDGTRRTVERGEYAIPRSVDFGSAKARELAANGSVKTIGQQQCDLVVGSGLQVEERVPIRSKGVPGSWPLYAWPAAGNLSGPQVGE